MKRLLAGCLLGALAACRHPTEVPLTHQHAAAYQQQVQLLQADKVDVGVRHPLPANPALSILTIEVVNPQHQPAAPDSLRQRLRKLAHLVVIDLARPADFEALNVQVLYRHGLFGATSDSAHTLIFPLNGLR